MIIMLPIRTLSEANSHTHWRVRAKRAKAQKSAAEMMLRSCAFWNVFPCVVTLTRIAPGKLDSDNLAGSGKHVQDGVASWLGVDDGDESKVRWEYAQRKAVPGERQLAVSISKTGRRSSYGVEVRITGGATP